jgi:hypothetical protein
MGRDSTRNSHVRQFAAGQIPSGPPIIRDAYGRGLAEGDQVQIPIFPIQLFTVRTITPVLDPNVPSGMLDMVMTCTVKFRAMRNQLNQEFVRVLTAFETAGVQSAIAAKPDADKIEAVDEPPAGAGDGGDPA